MEGEGEGSNPGLLPVPLGSRHSENFSFGRPKEHPRRTMDANQEEDMDHGGTTSDVEVETSGVGLESLGVGLESPDEQASAIRSRGNISIGA